MFADDLRTEPVGGGLQRSDIIHRQEGVVVFVEAYVAPFQFLLHKRVPVQPVRGVEWKEGSNADDDRPEHLVPNVEVVVGEAARLCGPLANSRFHHKPDPAERPNSKLEAAYHKADKAIENIVNLLEAA